MFDPQPTAVHAENVVPLEGLQLLRLFLSIESKEQRDAVYQMVEKYARL